LAAGEVISQLGEQLEQAGMLNVFAIPRARMPVVKFEHPDTGARAAAAAAATAGWTAVLWANASTRKFAKL
jgi:hypothetical protein